MKLRRYAVSMLDNDGVVYRAKFFWTMSGASSFRTKIGNGARLLCYIGGLWIYVP